MVTLGRSSVPVLFSLAGYHGRMLFAPHFVRNSVLGDVLRSLGGGLFGSAQGPGVPLGAR